MPKILKTRLLKDNKSKKSYSVKTIYLFAAAKGLVFTFICFFIISFLLYKNNNFSFFYKMIIYLSIALGAFISGFIAYKKVRGRGFINGIICSLIFCAALLLVLIIAMKLNFSGNLLILLPITVVSGFLGGTVSANT